MSEDKNEIADGAMVAVFSGLCGTRIGFFLWSGANAVSPRRPPSSP